MYNTDPDRLLVLNCGSIKDVYPTVDFGTKTDPSKAFALQRKFAPKGPLVSLRVLLNLLIALVLVLLVNFYLNLRW